MPGPLKNPRHENFARLLATGVKPVDAYRSLGYSAKGAVQSASALKQRPDISSRITELQVLAAANHIAKTEFNRERVLNRLDVLSRKAEELGQISAAARCEELIGRAEGGMFIDRQDQTVWDGDFKKLTAAQKARAEMSLEEVAFADDPAGLEAWRKAKAEAQKKEPGRATEAVPAEPAGPVQ